MARVPLRRSGSTAKPLAELGGHSHWVWQARFCPAHDCLLLSASSDALVNLWYAPWLGAAAGTPGRARVASKGTPGGPLGGGAGVGGAPSPSRAGGGGRGGAKEGRVRALDDHEDSVYSAHSCSVFPYMPLYGNSGSYASLSQLKRPAWPVQFKAHMDQAPAVLSQQRLRHMHLHVTLPMVPKQRVPGSLSWNPCSGM